MALSNMSEAKAVRLATQGRDAYLSGRHADAISLIGQAIYLRPNEPSLLGLRGEAHLKLCDLQSAIALLRGAENLELPLQFENFRD